MGMQNLIASSVNTAFKAAGDLVSPAVFYKNSSVFDFNTNSTVETTDSVDVKRVIIYASVKKRGDKNSEAPQTKATHDLIVEKSALSSTAFDRVLVDNVYYKILPEIQDYKFVCLLKLIKEN